MLRVFTFLSLIGLALAGELLAANDGHGNFASRKLQVGEATREYRLVVPKSVDLKKAAPLVIAFHGMGIDSQNFMPFYSGLNQTAEKHKFILAYPAAVDQSWGLKPEKVKSDLAFFDALVEKLNADYKIDNKRIYVLGMSNGVMPGFDGFPLQCIHDICYLNSFRAFNRTRVA